MCCTCWRSATRQRKHWWIDKKDSRILREDHAGSSAVFTTLQLNDLAPDDLFEFTPLPGAKVERRP
jgi:hypothetical protein